MPSPHTLGSIMHQPLAALTPLLLFPLENRTSTHPPQYAREPPRIPLVVPPPLSLRRPPQPPSRRLPPRRRLSRIRAPVKYSGNHSPPSSLSRPATFAILRILSPFRTERERKRRRDSRPISRARFLPPLPVVDLLRGVSLPLSLSLPVFAPSVLLFSPSLSSLLSRSLLWKRLVSSSSRFPSLLPLRSAPATTAAVAAVAAELLFRGSHALRRLTPFVRLASTNPFYHCRSLSATHRRTHSLSHTHTETPYVRLSLADYLPRSFFILSQPCSRPSVSAFRNSSSASRLSHHCPENPPFLTHRISLQGRPASAIHPADPPPLLFRSC